ncbi:hypothetical protein JOM56_010816 [Amanita muscaria]
MGFQVLKSSADDGLISVRPGGGGGSCGGQASGGGGGGGGDEPSGNGGTRGRGSSSALTRSLRSSDHAKPPSRKGRTNMCLSKVLGEQSLALEDRTNSSSMTENQSRAFLTILTTVSPERMYDGLNPDEWEVTSSFSYDERLQTKIYENSIAARTSSEPDSEGGLGDPKRWRFGPSYRSNMIIVASALFESTA